MNGWIVIFNTETRRLRLKLGSETGSFELLSGVLGLPGIGLEKKMYVQEFTGSVDDGSLS